MMFNCSLFPQNLIQWKLDKVMMSSYSRMFGFKIKIKRNNYKRNKSSISPEKTNTYKKKQHFPSVLNAEPAGKLQLDWWSRPCPSPSAGTTTWEFAPKPPGTAPKTEARWVTGYWYCMQSMLIILKIQTNNNREHPENPCLQNKFPGWWFKPFLQKYLPLTGGVSLSQKGLFLKKYAFVLAPYLLNLPKKYQNNLAPPSPS